MPTRPPRSAGVQAGRRGSSVPLLSLALSILLAATQPGCSKDSGGGIFSNSMSVVTTTPPNGSTQVANASTVSVTFSTAVNDRSLTTQSFAVVGSSSGAHDGTFTVSDDGRTVTFTPSAASPFKPGETVTVTISDDVLGKNGTLAKDTVFSFTVAGDPSGGGNGDAPVVISRSPGRNETRVARDATIAIAFDRELDPATVSPETVTVQGDLSGGLAPDISLSSNGSGGTVLTLTPSRELFAQERVHVRLSTGIRSEEGKGFDGETYSFQTGSLPQDLVDGNLMRGTDIAVNGTVVGLRTADLDRDGRLDLVVSSVGSEELQILRGAERGKFEPQATVDVGQQITSFVTVDIDGNGWFDLAVGTMDRVVVVQNLGKTDGTIQFQAAFYLATGSPVRGIVAADLDHFGVDRFDFVLDTEAGLRIYTDGLGGTPVQEIGEARVTRTPIVLEDLTITELGVAADGFLDLVYGDAAGNRVTYHTYDPVRREFSEARSYDLATDAVDLDARDLDLDGSPELVALLAHPDGSESIQFVDTSGDGGSVISGPLLLPGVGSSTLTLGDLDGDGWFDVLLSNDELASIRYIPNLQGSLDLENTADGIIDGIPFRTAVVGDFTGDGTMDLIGGANDRLVGMFSETVQDPGTTAVLAVGSAAAKQGETSIRIPVTLDSPVDIEGFRVLLGYDAARLDVRDVDFTGTATAARDPDFKTFDLDAAGGLVDVQVTFDTAPLESKVLPAGTGMVLFETIADVPLDTPPGDLDLGIRDAAGSPEIRTRLTHAGAEVAYTAVPGVLTVLEKDPPPAANTVSLPVVEAAPGDTGVAVPVLLSNEDEVNGFSAVVGFDREAVAATAIDLGGSATSSLTVLFDSAIIDPEAGWASYNAILSPMVLDNVLPAGEDQLLFTILFDVLETASTGDHALAFVDSTGDPPIETTLSTLNPAATFATVDGNLRVVQAGQSPSNSVAFVVPTLAQGQTGVSAELRLTNESPVERLTTIAGFDPTVLNATGSSLVGTVSQDRFPFILEEIDNARGEMVLDLLFENVVLGGESLPPGANQLVARLLFDVLDDAAPGQHTLALLPSTSDGGFETQLRSDGVVLPLGSSETVFEVTEVDNPNGFDVADVNARPGQEGVRALVRLSSEFDVLGLTVTGAYPPDTFTVVNFDISATAIGALEPEFVVPDISPAEGYFSYTAIFDFSPPFTDKQIPAGTEAAAVHIVVDVPAELPPGDYPIDLDNVLGTARLANSMVVRDQTGATVTVFPRLRDGILRVGDFEPTFLRGDVDNTGDISNDDYVLLLNYVVYGGAEPVCLDAADVDDSGMIDTVDLQRLVEFTFLGTPLPAPPFLDGPGVDPTEDGLDCKQGL